MQTEKIYDSTKKIPFQDIREIYNYRFLIVQMVRRDILTRYKRSFLGVAWTMLNPLGTMLVLSVVFSSIFSTTKDYPVYVLTGILAWNFFSKSTNAAMNNMVWGGTLLRRIYLPPTAFSVSAIGTEIVNLLLSLVPLTLLMVFMHFHFSIAMIFLPVSILILACFSLGIALALSTFAVYFPDVAEMYQIILTAWMYLSPVIIPLETFPKKFLYLMMANPLTSLIQLFRIPIYYERFPTLAEFLPAAGWGIGILIIGWFIFINKIDEYAYRV
jgi:ABC-type polysaccharide/polyol phosphate export permease